MAIRQVGVGHEYDDTGLLRRDSRPEGIDFTEYAYDITSLLPVLRHFWRVPCHISTVPLRHQLWQIQLLRGFVSVELMLLTFATYFVER